MDMNPTTAAALEERPNRRQRRALRRVRRAALRCQRHLRVAHAAGWTKAGRKAVEKRDDRIRKALLLGCSWHQIIFGPGTRCFTDLYAASEESVRTRFGAAADGIIEEQEAHRKLLQRIEDEDRHHLGATDMNLHLLTVSENLRQGRIFDALIRRGITTQRHTRLAEEAADRLNEVRRELDNEEADERTDWGWTPETKASYWLALESLERRLVAAVTRGAPSEEIEARTDEIRGLVVGDRHSNLVKLGEVVLTEEEQEAPISRECFQAGLG